MTPRYIFTVHTLHKKKIEDAFDKWEKRGLSKSRKICEAIVKLHDEEEKGSKITAFNGQQKPLDLFPKVIESWTPDMLQQFDIKDIQKVRAELYKRNEELGLYLSNLAKLR